MRYKGICFAIEDDASLVNPEVEEVVEVPAEVEADIAEVQQEEGDASELTEAIDETSSDLETLEEVRDVMADSVEAGEGVDQPAAAIAEIAVESICRRLGMKRVEFIPAMESFGSKNNRVAATRIAVEGITDTLKKGWESFLNWLKELWNKISSFFSKLFDGNLKLEKAAEEMKKSAEKLDASHEAKAKEIEASSIASAFGMRGKVSLTEVNEVIGNHVKMTSAIAGVNKSFLDAAKELDTMATECMKSKKADIDNSKYQASFDKIGAEMVSALRSGGPSQNVKTAKNGKAETVTIGPFINNYELKVVVGHEKADATVEKQIAGFKVEVSYEQKGDSKSAKVKVLTKEEMIKVCDDVLSLTKATASFKETADQIKKVNEASVKLIDDVIKGINAIYSAAAGKEEHAISGLLAKVRSSVQSVNNASSKFATKLPSINVAAGKVALNYVGASISEYAAKKEETKK